MTVAPGGALTLAEAVDLVHALVAQRAADVGVRVLFIKGPAARAQLLRPPGGSNDVDVFVEPALADLLLADLESLGWQRVLQHAPHAAGPSHSVTLWHPEWACEVDVHHRFPGFLSPPDDQFERLWADHEVVEVAHQPLRAPRVDRHLLVLALHVLRSTKELERAGSTQLPHALLALADAFRRQVPDTLRDRFAVTAAELGASRTARAFLGAVGVAPLPEVFEDPSALARWDRRGRPGRVTSVAWVTEVRRARLVDVPWVLWRAVWPSRRVIGALMKRNPTLREVSRYRWRRFRRGMRALPGAVRATRDRDST